MRESVASVSSSSQVDLRNSHTLLDKAGGRHHGPIVQLVDERKRVTNTGTRQYL